MSRAFVKENDDAVEDLLERPVSTAPNLVTASGLAAIEAELSALSEALAAVGDDRVERARLSRDLRYWSARRSTAQLVPPADCENVRFGCTVTIERDDGRTQTFRIFGEDEAAPEAGTISHVSPLARALLGKSIGDTARVADHEIEITKIA